MKDYLRRESVVDIQDDGDPYWFNNPQYRLSVDEPLEVGPFGTSIVHQMVGNRPQYSCLRRRSQNNGLTLALDTISWQVYISLMQQDRRSANHLRENYRIAFEVVQTKRHTTHKRLVI